MNKFKPEAAYFGPSDGKRRGMMFFWSRWAVTDCRGCRTAFCKSECRNRTRPRDDRRRFTQGYCQGGPKM